MAVVFVFTCRLFVLLAVFAKSLVGFSTQASSGDGFLLPDCKVSTSCMVCLPNADLFTGPLTLYWTRPPGAVPYSPRNRPSNSTAALFVAVLLLSGDAELNPGPPVTDVLNIGYINAQRKPGFILITLMQ